MSWFALAGYGIAVLVYGAMTAVLLVCHPVGRRARWLTSAAAASTLWAAGIVLVLLDGRPRLPLLAGLDALHAFVWVGCAWSWLSSGPGQAAPGARRWPLAAAALIALWSLLASLSVQGSGDAWTVHSGLLGLASIGLLAVWQSLRLAPLEDRRRQLRLLFVAIAVLFAADFIVYLHAILNNGLLAALWESRGIANAAIGPLVIVAIKGQPEWEREPFVSRHVAFFTASLIGVGTYLLIMGSGLYLIRSFEGEWVFFLELFFLVAALGLLMAALLSRATQARLKVFLAKHFYRNKYDYRHEWLRLTEILGRTGQPSELAAAALRGMARILGTHDGDLWLAREGDRYEWIASLEPRAAAKPAYDREHSIISFLASRGWVIDSQEYSNDPARYGAAFGPSADGVLPRDAVIVPLDFRGFLQGFVVLQKPSAVGALNFEDHDILKTAGRQVAVLLAQSLAQDKLAETRQFEAMNKLSTFLMHDLKNLIAQQELVLSNAQRFRHRPEFLDDAAATIRSSVARMRRLLDQLQGPTPNETTGHRTDASKILAEVSSSCADREPVPEIESISSPLWVAMEREKLVSVLTHLIRNAQDATPASGRIKVCVAPRGGHVSITVADTGCGMDQTFVHDRLFRPFDSTKGVRGMGIGAYQARETVRSAGGDIDVRTAVGSGTTFTILLPSALPANEAVGQPAA